MRGKPCLHWAAGPSRVKALTREVAHSGTVCKVTHVGHYVQPCLEHALQAARSDTPGCASTLPVPLKHASGQSIQ